MSICVICIKADKTNGGYVGHELSESTAGMILCTIDIVYRSKAHDVSNYFKMSVHASSKQCRVVKR
jgi:hypothetical protein